MKINSTKLIGIIVVLVVLVGSYAIFHKSNKTTAGNSSPKSSVAAVNNTVLTTKSNSAIGQYLAAPNGMALYTYTGDSSGVSNVLGSLLASWPAYIDTGSTTNLPSRVGTIKRSDSGQTQYTYNGSPLYYFTADSAGQVTGIGVSNFKVATPAAGSSSSQSTTTAPSSSSSQSTNNSSSGNGY